MEPSTPIKNLDLNILNDEWNAYRMRRRTAPRQQDASVLAGECCWRIWWETRRILYSPEARSENRPNWRSVHLERGPRPPACGNSGRRSAPRSHTSHTRCGKRGNCCSARFSGEREWKTETEFKRNKCVYIFFFRVETLTRLKKKLHTNTLTRFLVYLALPDAIPNLMKYASKSLPEPSLLILPGENTRHASQKSQESDVLLDDHHYNGASLSVQLSRLCQLSYRLRPSSPSSGLETFTNIYHLHLDRQNDRQNLNELF